MSRPADRRVLEAERDFLLCSLADLEDEHANGELADDRYETLTATYTARAAAILRTLEHDAAHAASAPVDPPKRWWRPALPAAAVLAAVLVIGALVLPSALRARDPGETITGNAQSTRSVGDSLARAAQQDPDNPQARLAYARFLLDDGNLLDAVRQFDAASRLDPTNAEALAYSGWIIAGAGVTDAALERLDAAVAADPDYPDAHLFRGITLLNAGRAVEALPDLQRYLELAPDAPRRAEVEALIDRASQAATTAKP